MELDSIDPPSAEGIFESLRYGIPPQGYVRHFTVGRDEELERLRASLGNANEQKGGALLVTANYGAGKSHLLQVVREMSLEAGYAVSLVVVNAQGGVRFNQIDSIMGAICDRIEVPGEDTAGVGGLFEAFKNRRTETLASTEITSRGTWDYSDYLASAPMYIALRAWVNSASGPVHDRITDWLRSPRDYRSQRKLLYQNLVAGLRTKFRDPRSDWQFYSDEAFLFHTGGHRNAWAALADLDVIARASGLNGLILLFDEFEDVIQNLGRRDYEQEAMLNLFRFFAGDRFPNMAYFAVTPDFVRKCKTALLLRGVLDFDYHRFEQLPAFAMSQITAVEFREFASRARKVHGIAFEWDPTASLPDAELADLVSDLWSSQAPEKVRLAIQSLVEVLDDRLDDH